MYILAYLQESIIKNINISVNWALTDHGVKRNTGLNWSKKGNEATQGERT